LSRRRVQGNTAEHQLFAGVFSYVDENGEQRISAPAHTHKVVNINQAEGYKKKLEREGRGHNFTFADMENIKDVIDKVSDNYCGYFLYLQCFIDYDGVIVKPSKDSMAKLDIQTTLGLSRNKFADFLKEMIANDFIFVDGDVYRINPAYHFKGTTNNERVIKSFTTKIKELFGEVKAKDLGFIYKLLPFVHLETNTICANPYEQDVTKIIPLNKQQVADITGLSEKSVFSKLRKLKLGDEFVFAEVEVKGIGNVQFVKINPFIFYRKKGEADPTLRELFSIYNNFRKK
jgi:hypothetical protein